MKRSSYFEGTNGSNASIDFYGGVYNGDGDCNMIGCGDDPGYQRADTVISSASKHDASTADFFLDQTSDASSRGRRKSGRTRPAKNKDDYDNDNGKHADLSSLIASELSKLSIEDRQKALEEIHGVVETNNEDPKEMQNLLDQVKEEVKRIRYKQAYEKAAFLSNAYVTDPDFVVYFLRADNYNPRKAAIRLVEHFKHKSELFGEHTLIWDIMYDDLSEVEKAILKSGFVYTLPKPDRAGRQVTLVNMNEFLKTGTLMDMNRAIWYLSVRNIQMYNNMSKLGMVTIYFTHGMGNIFEKLSCEHFIRGTAFLGNSLPYKYTSVHFCFEHNTFASVLQTALMMSLGQYARTRLRSHCGSRMESRYALRSFGIHIDGPGNDDPMSLADSGVKRCQEFDQYCRQKQNARLLPRPNDVLLGRGRPFQLYSGNLALTATIDRYRAEYTSSKKMHKKAITAEVVNNILLSDGRFLRRANNDNNNGIDWEEVDFETARLKVSHSFRTMSKWHADNGIEGNENRGDRQSRGSEDESIESIPSIVADESTSLGLMVEPASFSPDVQTNNINHTNKRRKWQNY